MLGGGYALRLRFGAGARGPLHALPEGRAPNRRGLKAREGRHPEGRRRARRRRRAGKPRRQRSDASTWRPWARDACRAGRRPSRCSAARSARGSVRCAPPISTRPARSTGTTAPRSPLGQAARAEARVGARRAGSLLPPMAVPKKKAVAQPHRQAAGAAQDRHARAERLPAVSQPSAARIGCGPVVRLSTPAARSWRRSCTATIPSTSTTSSGAVASAPSPSPSRARPQDTEVCGRRRLAMAPDLGPAEVAAGAAIAATHGARVILFGPAGGARRAAAGRRCRRRSRVDRQERRPGERRAREPAGVDRAGRARSRRRQRAGARVRGRAPARRWRRGCSTSSASAASIARRWRFPLPVPGHPVTLLDVGANAVVRREHLVQFAFMGAALSSTVLGVARPRVGLLSQRRGGRTR